MDNEEEAVEQQERAWGYFGPPPADPEKERAKREYEAQAARRLKRDWKDVALTAAVVVIALAFWLFVAMLGGTGGDAANCGPAASHMGAC